MIVAPIGIALLTASAFNVTATAGAGVGGGPWQSNAVLAGGQVGLDVDLELDWFYVGASAQTLLYVNVPDPKFGPVLFSPGVGPHAGVVFGGEPFRVLVDVGGYVWPLIAPGGDGLFALVLPAGQARGRGEWTVAENTSVDFMIDATLTFTPGGTVALLPAALVGVSWRFPS